LARRNDPWTRHFLRENPGYREGHGLVVLLPISLASLIRGSWSHGIRTLERRYARPMPALEDGRVASEG
jgi:hypothetical protein